MGRYLGPIPCSQLLANYWCLSFRLDYNQQAISKLQKEQKDKNMPSSCIFKTLTFLLWIIWFETRFIINPSWAQKTTRYGTQGAFGAFLRRAWSRSSLFCSFEHHFFEKRLSWTYAALQRNYTFNLDVEFDQDSKFCKIFGREMWKWEAKTGKRRLGFHYGLTRYRTRCAWSSFFQFLLPISTFFNRFEKFYKI